MTWSPLPPPVLLLGLLKLLRGLLLSDMVLIVDPRLVLEVVEVVSFSTTLPNAGALLVMLLVVLLLPRFSSLCSSLHICRMEPTPCTTFCCRASHPRAASSKPSFPPAPDTPAAPASSREDKARSLCSTASVAS